MADSKIALRRAYYRGAYQGVVGSGAIWHDLPIDIDNPAVGYHKEFLFDILPKHATTAGGSVTAALGEYHAYLDQGGFIDTLGVANSGIKIGSDGDNECVTLIAGGSAKTLWAKTSPKAWFEIEFGPNNGATATKAGILAGLTSYGLSATDVLLTDTDTLADRDFIGFHKLETGGQVDFVFKAAGQTANITTLTNVLTFTGTTLQTGRFGIKLDPLAPLNKKLSVYANGVLVSNSLITDALLAGATWPSAVNLGLGVTVNEAATGSNYGVFRWARLAQKTA